MQKRLEIITIADRTIDQLRPRILDFVMKGYVLVRVINLGDGLYPSALLTKEDE